MAVSRFEEMAVVPGTQQQFVLEQIQPPAGRFNYLNEPRKAREREFHNIKFAGRCRNAAAVAYRSVQPADVRYLDRIRERARGGEILEFGCGPGTYSLHNAAVARRFVGIDISEIAIEQARTQARRQHIANAEFHVMDCEDPRLPPASFDLICGHSILHHLDLDRSFAVIQRLLKPGGSAVFLEPLGHNPGINFFRRLTPNLRTADEHPLVRADLETAGRYFGRVQIESFALLSVLAAPLSVCPGLTPVGRSLEWLDRELLKLPGVRWLGWASIWSLS